MISLSATQKLVSYSRCPAKGFDSCFTCMEGPETERMQMFQSLSK